MPSERKEVKCIRKERGRRGRKEEREGRQGGRGKEWRGEGQRSKSVRLELMKVQARRKLEEALYSSYLQGKDPETCSLQ